MRNRFEGSPSLYLYFWLYLTAKQLVDFPHGNGMEVVFGGGRRKFLHQNQSDPEYPSKMGERLDGKDLIQQWLDKHENSKYVWNQTGFDQIDPRKVDHVIGTSCANLLFKSAVLSYFFPYHENKAFSLISFQREKQN